MSILDDKDFIFRANVILSLRRWYATRGFRFTWQRGTKLLLRYSMSPTRAIHRLDRCVRLLAELGCAPTLPTPGHVVQRYPQFIRSLEVRGSEIAVHSYEHVDLGALPVLVARQQLEKAIRTFEHFEIEAHGFRCPYLGWSEELRDALPIGMFDYSSNEAICFEPDELGGGTKNEFYEAVRRFYQGKLFSENICLPSTRQNLIEIPVCVPDDLQLHDGMGLGYEEMNQVWGKVLDSIYQRGELFTLMFHPELASICEKPFEALLVRAGQFPLPVWIARLRDISDWWREKSKFKVEISPIITGLKLNFTCTPRATILARGLDVPESELMWDGRYYRIHLNTLEVPGNPRPFIGITAGISERVISFLRDQGYILDTSDTARCCGLILDTDLITKFANDVELVDYIEASPAPLIRYWRWPNGAKSALSITGDLDALTLLDYINRLFIP